MNIIEMKIAAIKAYDDENMIGQSFYKNTAGNWKLICQCTGHSGIRFFLESAVPDRPVCTRFITDEEARYFLLGDGNDELYHEE